MIIPTEDRLTLSLKFENYFHYCEKYLFLMESVVSFFFCVHLKNIYMLSIPKCIGDILSCFDHYEEFSGSK